MAQIILDTQSVELAVAALLLVTLLIGIVAAASKYMTRRVVDVIQDGQTEGSLPSGHDVQRLTATVNGVDTRMRSVERNQDLFSVQLNNGIKDRLDGIVAWQTTHEAKMDELFTLVNRMVGAWDGRERREA